jgi:hypothetical protein
MSFFKSFTNIFGQNKEVEIKIPSDTSKHNESQVWNFRNIKDVNNVEFYATLHLKENQMFLSYLFNNFKDCKLETKIYANELFSNAPDYAMPINFLLTKGEQKIAILLVEGGRKYQRYSVLETMELCKENNIKVLRFITTFPNEEEYVVQRVRETLE